MTGHTEGPWKVNKWPNDGAAGGFNFVVCNSAGHGVCTLNRHGDDDKTRANMHLIAAAPDLLAALTRITAGLNDRDDSNPAIKAEEVRQARAALAKAKGER